MFNPSKCLHAVYNVEFTVSLTHNYVDASNIADIVLDAMRSTHTIALTHSVPTLTVRFS